MHFAIIAAGEGSRLRQEGVSAPKPLVTIHGEPMIDRLLGIMTRCGAESISVICNAEMTEVQQHLQQYIQLHAAQVPIRLVVQSTPSSMHSLACLAEVIPAGQVCVTTVDTIFREADFAAYIQAFQQSGQGLFAVTPFVDDEKPLWVTTSAQAQPAHQPHGLIGPITGFYDRETDIPAGHDHWVSGGIYGLYTPTAWPVLRQCLAQGQHRMRNYQRALVQAGVALQAYSFEQIMDIDHATDISKAEQWLSVSNDGKIDSASSAASATPHRQLLLVGRAPQHSPNNIQKDAAILQQVAQRLQAQGHTVTTMSEEQFCAQTPAQLAPYQQVLHMARQFATLNRLQRLTVPVINRPQSVQTTAHSRELTFSLLYEAGLPVPPFWAYDPEEDEMFQCEPHLQQLLPGWVKATRPQGAQPDDVAWVETPLQADACVLQLAAQQVPDIIVMKHIPGDLLKVYAVVSSQQCFLRTFYPQEQNYSKFGQAEQHNAPLAHYSYSQSALQQLAQGIVQVLGLQIFGFDLIVGKDGSMTIIDVNDWPSFSFCRAEAAEAICLCSADRQN